ncbi:hypothetical protein QG516_09450 [Pedobacter gandavensis]|uniref:hypothetical protein n=1 Tax=Pedobacter gandavensis TaxID=2679963 RepID=UPI00247A7EE9|nr:hypothetical protein [Pedobacter gandavensis]WGQ11865.1 hypothetical protein QG516_09450 [Pedobacter gandavensis]
MKEQEESIAKQIEVELDLQSDNFKPLCANLLYFNTLLEQTIQQIKKLQMEKLRFAVEDIFRIVGQYDKYIIVYFYRSSAAFEKYGEEAHGHLIYQLKARNALTIAISDEDHERNDGTILLDTIGKDKEKIDQLKIEGFLASDIYKIQTFNHDEEIVKYKQKGIKEIPNTIKIEFESGSFDLPLMENKITSWKMQDGTKILPHEYQRYYTNQILMGDTPSDEVKELYLLDKNKQYKEEVLIQLYRYWFVSDSLDEAGKLQYKSLVKRQKERRIGMLKADLGITNSVWENFIKQHPEEYLITRRNLIPFANETLTNHITQFPIYWDEERFIHIYGRHYVDFFINFSTYKGTHFQYGYKDIRRLACLVLESLKQPIEQSLANGKGFNKYGDQGYYFNGNYYTLRISSAGRLMTFFPMDESK